MIRLKDCPKCRGDLMFYQDQYGSFFSCVQCGLIKDSIASVSNSKVSIKGIRVKEGQVVTS
jgi:DNA-directed RNA polymerase subunit M/transcription elongation factor TFIIS